MALGVNAWAGIAFSYQCTDNFYYFRFKGDSLREILKTDPVPFSLRQHTKEQAATARQITFDNVTILIGAGACDRNLHRSG